MKKSDKLSIIAITISIVSLIVTIILNSINLSTQYGEKLIIDIISLDHNNIHAYSFYRSKKAGSLLQQFSVWYKIRIINDSNKPISIVNAFYKEDDSIKQEIPKPLFKEVYYINNNKVILKEPVEFPLRLEVGVTKELYSLLPISVTKQLGALLLFFLRGNDFIMDSRIELVLFKENYLEEFENTMLEEMRKRKIAELIHFDEVNIDETETTRGLLFKKGDHYCFKDSSNDAKDGFRFKDGLKLHNVVTEFLLSSDSLTYPMVEPPYKNYHIMLQTGSGNFYEKVLKSSSLPFERMK